MLELISFLFVLRGTTKSDVTELLDEETDLKIHKVELSSKKLGYAVLDVTGNITKAVKRVTLFSFLSTGINKKKLRSPPLPCKKKKEFIRKLKIYIENCCVKFTIFFLLYVDSW